MRKGVNYNDSERVSKIRVKIEEKTRKMTKHRGADIKKYNNNRLEKIKLMFEVTMLEAKIEEKESFILKPALDLLEGDVFGGDLRKNMDFVVEVTKLLEKVKGADMHKLVCYQAIIENHTKNDKFLRGVREKYLRLSLEKLAYVSSQREPLLRNLNKLYDIAQKNSTKDYSSPHLRDIKEKARDLYHLEGNSDESMKIYCKLDCERAMHDFTLSLMKRASDSKALGLALKISDRYHNIKWSRTKTGVEVNYDIRGRRMEYLRFKVYQKLLDMGVEPEIKIKSDRAIDKAAKSSGQTTSQKLFNNLKFSHGKTDDDSYPPALYELAVRSTKLENKAKWAKRFLHDRSKGFCIQEFYQGLSLYTDRDLSDMVSQCKEICLEYAESITGPDKKKEKLDFLFLSEPKGSFQLALLYKSQGNEVVAKRICLPIIFNLGNLYNRDDVNKAFNLLYPTADEAKSFLAECYEGHKHLYQDSFLTIAAKILSDSSRLREFISENLIERIYMHRSDPEAKRQLKIIYEFCKKVCPGDDEKPDPLLDPLFGKTKAKLAPLFTVTKKPTVTVKINEEGVESRPKFEDLLSAQHVIDFASRESQGGPEPALELGRGEMILMGVKTKIRELLPSSGHHTITDALLDACDTYVRNIPTWSGRLPELKGYFIGKIKSIFAECQQTGYDVHAQPEQEMLAHGRTGDILDSKITGALSDACDTYVRNIPTWSGRLPELKGHFIGKIKSIFAEYQQTGSDVHAQPEAGTQCPDIGFADFSFMRNGQDDCAISGAQMAPIVGGHAARVQYSEMRPKQDGCSR